MGFCVDLYLFAVVCSVQADPFRMFSYQFGTFYWVSSGRISCSSGCVCFHVIFLSRKVFYKGFNLDAVVYGGLYVEASVLHSFVIASTKIEDNVPVHFHSMYSMSRP